MALFASIVVGCRSSPRGSTKTDVSTPAPLVDVQFSGCAAVHAGPVCELGDERVVRVWLPSAQHLVRLEIDASEIPRPQEEIVAGGALYRVPVSTHARALRVIVLEEGIAKSWTLPVGPRAALPEEVVAAKSLRDRGDLTAATATLTSALGRATEADRGAILDALGRLEALRDDFDAAAPHLREAITRSEASGAVSDAANEGLALVFILIVQRRFGEARKELARASRHAREFPDAGAMTTYYDAYLAKEAGDARGALRALYDAEGRYARLGLALSLQQTKILHSIELIELGRPRDAWALLRDIPEDGKASPCDRAEVRCNLGWIALMADELGDGVGIDPREPLEEAVALDRGACGNHAREAMTRGTLARAALDRNDVAAARAELSASRKAVAEPPPELSMEWIELEARIALMAGDAAKARASYERLGRLADAAGSLETAWAAADGRGQALLALGKRGEAVAAFADAERRLEEESRSVPIGEGRGSFLGARERSARRRVDLLLDGAPADALVAAREARIRVILDLARLDRIGSLEPAVRARFEDALGGYRRARDAIESEAATDWSLSAADLARATSSRRAREAEARAALENATASLPPAPPHGRPMPEEGELILAYFPIAEGWAGFAANRADVLAARLGPIDFAASPDALASRILQPFHARIAAASRIVVLGYGKLRSVDVHALPFDGAPLVAHAPVEYALDLGSKAIDSRASAGGALVVADPRSDLPSARDEARALLPSLERLGAVHLVQGSESTRATVQDELAGASLFHYAGHGAFAGRDGFESALLLAGENALNAGDVLAMPRVPSIVVLSGCETARAGDGSEPEALGIAQAFLAAGARRAIAASRDLKDTDAAAIMPRFYASFARSGDVAAALREAQLAAASASPPSDWAAFRALRR